MSSILAALASYELSTFEWGLVCFCAFVFALSKAGLKGIDIFAVPLMAIVFGGKASTGIVLPMLIAGDIFSVWYFNRDAKWEHLRKLAIWITLGILVAVWIGKDLPELVFKYALAFIILSSVVILIWLEQKKDRAIPNRAWFSVASGLLVGFATMVGNVGGAFTNIYFMAMKYHKVQLIGTSAWLFLFINLFKVPFHVLSWHTITYTSLAINLVVLPIIAIGLWVGIYLVDYLKEKSYRMMVLVLTAIGAVLVFFR
jgi:uncharacterized membrane protein YfcA